MKKLLLIFVALVALPLAATASNDDICNSVSGTVTAVVSTDPGFEGLYKYTITLDKHDEDEDDEWGFLLLLGLENCECKCQEGFIIPPKSGEIPGDDKDDHDGQCSVHAVYLCNGSPNIPPEINGPAIQFLGGESDDCDEDDSFTGVDLVFYTPLPPGASADHQIYLYDDYDDDDKDGSYDDSDEEDGPCSGTLTGTLPICDCTVDSQPSSWGTLKSTFVR